MVKDMEYGNAFQKRKRLREERREFLKLIGKAGLLLFIGPEFVSASQKKRFGMLIEAGRCTGCNFCLYACNHNYGLPREGEYRTKVTKREGGFLPQLCNHCSAAPCVKVCPVKATYKNETGLVLIDSQRCIGCRLCLSACPYKARFLHPTKRTVNNPDLSLIDKCNFCFPRIREGLEPYCVIACPVQVRIFGDLLDKKSRIYELVNINKGRLSVLKPNLRLGPSVFYLGLKIEEKRREKGR